MAKMIERKTSISLDDLTGSLDSIRARIDEWSLLGSNVEVELEWHFEDCSAYVRYQTPETKAERDERLKKQKATNLRKMDAKQQREEREKTELKRLLKKFKVPVDVAPFLKE